jgi:hypothetical protein
MSMKIKMICAKSHRTQKRALTVALLSLEGLARIGAAKKAEKNYLTKFFSVKAWLGCAETPYQSVQRHQLHKNCHFPFGKVGQPKCCKKYPNNNPST